MKPIKDEKGTVLILELILLAVVVGVAGLAFYQAYKARQTTNQAVISKPHIASPIPAPTSDVKASSTPAVSSTPTPAPTPIHLPAEAEALVEK